MCICWFISTEHPAGLRADVHVVSSLWFDPKMLEPNPVGLPLMIRWSMTDPTIIWRKGFDQLTPLVSISQNIWRNVAALPAFVLQNSKWKRFWGQSSFTEDLWWLSCQRTAASWWWWIKSWIETPHAHSRAHAPCPHTHLYVSWALFRALGVNVQRSNWTTRTHFERTTFSFQETDLVDSKGQPKTCKIVGKINFHELLAYAATSVLQAVTRRNVPDAPSFFVLAPLDQIDKIVQRLVFRPFAPRTNLRTFFLSFSLFSVIKADFQRILRHFNCRPCMHPWREESLAFPPTLQKPSHPRVYHVLIPYTRTYKTR